jgi:ketosteroid isomerase-like protein
MNKLSFFIIGLLFSFSVSAQVSSNDQKAILALLSKQQNDWNVGDIPAFMEGYWKSDSLCFIGANGPTYGWQNTLDNYKRRYPDRATMGTLRFDIIKINVFEKKTGLVIGKWHLTRPEKGDVGGHYTLALRKINGQWRIINDHTS